MKIVKIHPEEKPGLALPYPWMIDEDGIVLRQDFWKGKPYKLIGFQKEDELNMDLTFKEFWKCPKKAVGLFPIFMHLGGIWTTYFGSKVDRVSVENKGGL